MNLLQFFVCGIHFNINLAFTCFSIQGCFTDTGYFFVIMIFASCYQFGSLQHPYGVLKLGVNWYLHNQFRILIYILMDLNSNFAPMGRSKSIFASCGCKKSYKFTSFLIFSAYFLYLCDHCYIDLIKLMMHEASYRHIQHSVCVTRCILLQH